MFGNIAVDGIVLLILVVIAVNFLQIVKGILDWYRITNYVAYKTSITVTELQKMLENRRLHTQNR
jgi:hypothetical protein